MNCSAKLYYYKTIQSRKALILVTSSSPVHVDISKPPNNQYFVLSANEHYFSEITANCASMGGWIYVNSADLNLLEARIYTQYIFSRLSSVTVVLLQKFKFSLLSVICGEFDPLYAWMLVLQPISMSLAIVRTTLRRTCFFDRPQSFDTTHRAQLRDNWYEP